MRSSPLSGEVVTVSAADPLNLVGILVPGERVPAISGRSLGYRDGVAHTLVMGELAGRQEAAAV
jgi:ATP-dependent Lhr-like helicase